MSSIGTAVGIPFTTIRGFRVGQYLLYNDGGAVTWRKGVRGGYFVLDKTLDATGFAGVENVNWENVKSVIGATDSTFITEWTVPNGAFALPLVNTYNYNFTVNWGDASPVSTVTAWDDADATHVYVAGTYQISINGTCEKWYLDGSGIETLLDKVIQWGDCGWVDASGMFSGCENLTDLPDGPMTGFDAVIDFGSVFNYTLSLTTIPDGLFDLCINAQSMSQIFAHNPTTTIPSGLFDYCTLVTSFAFAFWDCTSLLTIPVGLFDNNVSVNTFTNCFDTCSSLLSIPITLFDLCPLVTTYFECFTDCISLTGNAPALWSLAGPPVGTDCFNACVGLTNYAAIPAAWK